MSHRAKVRELEAGLGDEPRLRGELDDVKRKLEVFEAAGHADVLKEYQKRLSQRRAVGVWEDAWADVGQRLREFSEALTPEALEADPFVGEDDVDLKLLAATVTIRERFKAIKEAVANQGGAADSIAQDWRSARSASDWNTAVETAIRGTQSPDPVLQNSRA